MAREEPRDHKYPKHDIAEGGEAKIFEAFSKLFSGSANGQLLQPGLTYWKYQIDEVHQHQNQVANPSLVVGV